jgi:hypothetical protein
MGFIGVASQTVGSKRLMRTGLRLQAVTATTDNKVCLTVPSLYIIASSPCISLLPLLSATPHVSYSSATVITHLSIALLQPSIVLPHEAPSRVIAVASVLQPYSPLIPRARARPLVDAPPFTSSTVDVLAS